MSTIRLSITARGLGGSAVPVANTLSEPSFFVNISTLHGENTMGQKAEAITDMSCLKNLINLSFSEPAA